jgi:hypothetical protein
MYDKCLFLREVLNEGSRYRENSVQTFIDDGVKRHYSTNKLLKIAETIKVKLIKVTELDHNSMGLSDPKWKTKEHIERFKNSDTKIPIIIVREKGKIRIVDGNHRAIKAIQDGLTEIPAKELTASQLEQARISDDEAARIRKTGA